MWSVRDRIPYTMEEVRKLDKETFKAESLEYVMCHKPDEFDKEIFDTQFDYWWQLSLQPSQTLGHTEP